MRIVYSILITVISILYCVPSFSDYFDSVNVDDILSSKKIVIIGTVVTNDENKDKFKERDMFRHYKAKVRVERVVKGTFSFREVVVSYTSDGHLSRSRISPPAPGDKVFLFPETNSPNWTPLNRYPAAFDIISSAFWFKKSSTFETGLLRDMGFKYYSKGLAIKLAYKSIFDIYKISRPEVLKFSLSSIKQYWVVHFSYKNGTGKKTNGCFSFQIYDGKIFGCQNL